MRRILAILVGLLLAVLPAGHVQASDPGIASGSATLISIVVDGNVVRFTWTSHDLEPEGGRFAASFRGCKDPSGLYVYYYPKPVENGDTEIYTMYADLLGPDFAVDLAFTSWWKNARGESHEAAEYGPRFAEFECGVEYADSWTIEGEAVPDPVVNTTAPSVNGIPRVGVKLTAAPGAWNPASTYGYQWLADGSVIPGATASTYTPTSGVKGKQISVQVRASASGYQSSTATSSPTTPVAAGIIKNTALPSITGIKRVGSTLTAHVGTWAPAGLTYRYRWFKGTTAITGATGRTYKLPAAVRGKRIRVRVTAVRAGYTSGAKYSTYTVAIK